MRKHIGWLVVGMVALGVVSVQAEEQLTLRESALDKRLKEAEAHRTSAWVIEPHRPSYVLPVSYVEDPSEKLEGKLPDGTELDEIEIKFQFSFRLSLAEDLMGGNGDLFFAYTQVSVWQAYNFDNSAPFRDTNYEPEMFLAFDTDYDVLGLHGRLVSLGLVHQSNGRGNEEISRSWNRLYANIVMERGNFALSLKPWYRIPENDEDDNNPDIEDYMGYGELRAAYKYGEHVFATMLRNNLKFPDENRSGVELDWSFPLYKNIKGYVQYFYGYGETLLDYNECDQRIGAGFLLADWL
jgi:phospholipase A1/A2